MLTLQGGWMQLSLFAARAHKLWFTTDLRGIITEAARNMVRDRRRFSAPVYES